MYIFLSFPCCGTEGNTIFSSEMVETRAPSLAGRGAVAMAAAVDLIGVAGVAAAEQNDVFSDEVRGGLSIHNEELPSIIYNIFFFSVT